MAPARGLSELEDVKAEATTLFSSLRSVFQDSSQALALCALRLDASGFQEKLAQAKKLIAQCLLAASGSFLQFHNVVRRAAKSPESLRSEA